MTYEELSKQIAQLGLIPQQELPYFDIVLKDETKQKLAERSPQDAAMFYGRLLSR